MKSVFSFLTVLAITVALAFHYNKWFLAPIAALIILSVWLVWFGMEARAASAKDLLGTTLMPGEAPSHVALQHRIHALSQRREMLAITDSRVIFLKRGLIGGFKMHDIQWKDLRDARLEQNMVSSVFGSNLAFDNSSESVGFLSLKGVPSRQASEIYSRAQFEEQAWEEKRRIRAMEETRARAGGVTIHNPTASSVGHAGTTDTPTFSQNKLLIELQKAKELLDLGVISDSEFQELKARIISTP